MAHSFNGIGNQLKKIGEEIKEEAEGNVTFEELFDLGFMDRNSDFDTIEKFFAFHGIKIDTQEDYEALDENILDKAVAASTKFSTWKDMSESAAYEYTKKKLINAGFDITE